jgi:hypothetical protein
MKEFIQESTMLSKGIDFAPTNNRYAVPVQNNSASVFLLSNSFEYDIQLIKHVPMPKISYKNILIPVKMNITVGTKPFRYGMTTSDYNKKLLYVNNQNLVPKLQDVRYPYPSHINENLYIPMSDLINKFNSVLQTFSAEYIRDNIFGIFAKVMNVYNFSKTRVMIIDTARYRLFDNMSMSTYKSDLINALLTGYMLSTQDKLPRLNWTFIFRAPEADYKFDLSKFTFNDREKLRNLLATIGLRKTIVQPEKPKIEDADKIDTDKVVDNIDKPGEETETDGEETPAEIKNFQNRNLSATDSLKSSLSALSSHYGVELKTDENDASKKLYNAKTTDIAAQLLSRINKVGLGAGTNTISRYEVISKELTSDTHGNEVENKLLDAASKNVAATQAPVDTTSVENTVSSAREAKIRKEVGQLKLNNVTFDTLTSITDVPLPKKVIPLHTTTTSKSALAGTGFTNVSREYEQKLMNRDIVATFMHMSALPDGFYVTNVEVEDMSSSTTLMDNWKITVKNKQSGLSNTVSLRIPKVVNGKFYNNGCWYNIGKQDFPIPILKIDKKKVIITSNYNKITVQRYDTKSLVDIGMFTKMIASMTDKTTGSNKYVRPGNSSGTNSRFISTIEYDEYSKQWDTFTNKEAKCMIFFNRNKCMKNYQFVVVKDNEFCCGMLNEQPIVINTDTGLTREGKSLTETMLSTLPPEIAQRYAKMKPGKGAMYSEIKISNSKFPLGCAIAAWEGLSSLIKYAKSDIKYVDKSFSDPHYFIIPFRDKNLAIQNTVQNQLLFNGFYKINTKAYDIAEFNLPIMKQNSVYVELFNQHFFKTYSQLTPFITYYNFFVDAMTKDVCHHYNIPDDICSMLVYSSNLLADNGHGAETQSSLYRIRSSEIIPAIVHYKLAYAISEYNNKLGSKARGTAKFVINPNEVINELMSNVPNVAPLSALNPFVELHVRENISRKGFRGVNDERTFTIDKRSFDETMIGKMAISSPNNKGIGVTRQLTADPKIESVRGYTSTKGVDSDFNDLQLASFSELMTPGTVSRDDAIRTAIATSQTGHIVQTADAQPALISNGVDEIVPAYLTDEFSVMAKQDGTVIDMNEEYMIVKYKDNTKQAVPLAHRYSFNTGSSFYVDNQLVTDFKVNDKFKQNEILAYHPKFFTKGSDNVVRMNIGPIAKVAFMETYATYEDAGIVTSKFSKKMATKITMCQDIKLDATDDVDFIVKPGDEVEIGDTLLAFGLGDTGEKAVDNFLKAFQSSSSVIDNAKRRITAKNAGRVVDVRMYTCKSMDKLSPSLYKLLSDYFKENKKRRKILDAHDNSSSVYKMNTLFSLPTEPIKGNSIKGITTDVYIEIFIEHEYEQAVGDKAVAYGAMKQITSEVIPEGLEPFAESNPNEEISMFVNSSSILKRMTPSIPIIAAGNKVLFELKKQIGQIWNNG